MLAPIANVIASVLGDRGGSEVLHLEQLPMPEPKPGEMRTA